MAKKYDKVSMLDIMRDNYMIYAKSTIIDRSFPFIDGYKPVQRKILYSMHELGLETHAAKSARVVGDVMGKYHPHGNLAIYEAMCQMGDTVESRNAPEVQATGCFGKSWSTISIPKAHERYCILGKSMVSTNLGVYKIEDLEKFADGEDIDLYVKGYSDKNYHVSKFFDSGEHDVITIKLNNGMELTGTYNHPVMVLNNKMEFSWKLLPELKVGDKILLSRYDNDLFGSNNDILEAKMLGCMISDGYITAQNSIGINNTDIEMIKPVKEWFDKQVENQANINDIGKGCYDYCIENKELCHAFIEKYQFASKIENKIIPQCVFNGTREYIKNFLSYLFEGDANVYTESTSIVYSTYSKELVHQLQVLLLQSFGILSSISFSKGEEYKLYISSLDLERFRDKIGFVSNIKKEKLIECINILKSKDRIESDSYYINIELSNYLQSILPNHWDAKGYSYVNIKNIERCKNDLTDEQYKHFYDLVSNYVTIEIKEIVKEKEPQRVYSLKVDDESHSFCANGFINHNTEAKLTKLVADCHFKGLHKDAVDFIENFDNTLKEPLLLPVIYPNIIVNTSSGVACGIRTYIPCYTLKNACEATIGLLNGKIKTNEALADALDAPDFQTGGIINMTHEQKMELVTTGATRGIYITSRYKFDPKKNEMTIYEIPYNTTCEKITSQIEECIKERKIQGITRVVNGADKDGLGIVVFIQRGYNVEDVFKYLCAFTDVQTKISFQTKFIHIDPETGSMNYKEVGIYELLDSYWIPWRMEVIRRMNRFELKKLEEDRHKLLALDIVGDRIREYVDIVLENNRKEAREKHLTTFDIDEIQEDYMLSCSIDSLTLDGVLRARDKINKLTEEVNKITIFISDEKSIKKQMIDELNMVIKKYSIPRKSSSEDIGTLVHLTKEEATAISDEEVWVGITEKCRLKKAMTEKDADNFESKVESGDALWVTYQMNNKDNLLVYTTAGCIYKLPVNSLDSSARTNFKDSAWRFISKDSEDVHRELERKSDIFFISPLGKGKDGFNIVYREGLVKKIRYDAYNSKRKIYRKAFPEYDDRGFIVDYDEMLLMTTMGRALVTDVSHLLDSDTPTKSSTLQRLPKLREGEEIVAVYCVDDLKGFISDEVIDYYRKKYWVRAKRGAYDITSSLKLMKLALEQRENESESEDNESVVDSDNVANEFITTENNVIEPVTDMDTKE